MLTSQFDYKAPTTVKELFNDLHAHPNAAILSGGHSLVSLLKTGAITPDVVISTDKIKSFKEIKEESDGSVLIGSSVPLSALLDHSSIGTRFPALREAIKNIGDRQYCNQTSIGDEFSYQGISIGVLAVLLSYGAKFHYSKGSETIKISNPLEKPKQAILSSIELNLSNGTTQVREMKDPVSCLPLCGVAAQVHGSKDAIQAVNFTIYGKGITPTRLTAIEDHIKEAGTVGAIEADKIGTALTTAVQTSAANPAYLTNLVYSFTKKIMSTVQ